MSGPEFSTATGNRPAEIASGEGGTFSVFGGAIHGRHIELVPGKRVVQAWRVQNWEPGAYSVVRFTLSPEGSGTKVTLDHSSFPDGEDKHLDPGWHTNYWEPLTKYLG
jgi:activator of HSP90 ATPase